MAAGSLVGGRFRMVVRRLSPGKSSSRRAWATTRHRPSGAFYAFASGVHYVGVDRKTPDGIKAVRLSRELKPLRERYQQPSHERLADWTVSFDTALVERIATEIAAPLGFARVDFLFAPDGACFLNEVTLTPGNAGNYMHPELDLMLGRMWSKLL